MPIKQGKNIINHSHDNMSPPETSYPTTTRPEYSNTSEAQNLKTNFTKMIEVFKEKNE